jgi:hypothetical protein
MTLVEVEGIVTQLVSIWVGQLQRSGEIRPDASDAEIQDFKDGVVVTVMQMFRDVGILDDLLTGTKTNLMELVAEYLKKIS